MHEPLPEILDVILEFLHPEDWEAAWDKPLYGKSDLQSCSLVSHTWHALVQRHLFRDVVYLFLRTPDDSTLLCDGKSPSSHVSVPFAERSGMRYKTLSMFLSFLEEHPPIQYMVHRLRLEVRPLEEPHGLTGRQFTEEDCVDTTLFLRLFTLLPNLAALHLCNVVLSEDPPPGALLPSLPRLYVSYRSNLYSHDWTWHSSGNFVRTYRLLSCFSKLDELHMHALGDLAFFIRSPNGERKPAKLNLGIRSLILESISTSSGKVYEAFLDSPTVHTLRCLVHTDLISTMGRQNFLRRVGPNLRQLRYELPVFLQSPQAAIFDISPCINLRTLTVGFTMDAARRHGSADTMTNLLHLLSFSERMSLPRLKDFTLQVAFEADANPMQHWDTWYDRCKGTLAAVDDALVCFAERWILPAVHFECYFREGHVLDLSQAQWMLSRVFSRLNQERKLQFRNAGPKKWMIFDPTVKD